ncbi:S8 family serine peptidase [Thermoproteota archaeon]
MKKLTILIALCAFAICSMEVFAEESRFIEAPGEYIIIPAKVTGKAVAISSQDFEVKQSGRSYAVVELKSDVVDSQQAVEDLEALPGVKKVIPSGVFLFTPNTEAPPNDPAQPPASGQASDNTDEAPTLGGSSGRGGGGITIAPSQSSTFIDIQPVDPGNGEKVPNDPYLHFQSYLDTVNATKGWFKQTKGAPVAVLSTGVYYDHEDLVGNVDHSLSIDCNTLTAQTLQNYYGLLPYPGFDYTSTTYDDYYGYGTVIAGTVGAVGNNNTGISGIAWGGSIGAPPIVAVRCIVPAQDGAGNAVLVMHTPDFFAAVDHCITNNIKVILFSWWTSAYPPGFEQLIDLAYQNGSILIAPVSDSSFEDEPSYPASFSNVIGVGSVDLNKNHAPGSSYGRFVDLVEPGYKSGMISTRARDTLFLGAANIAPGDNKYYYYGGPAASAAVTAGIASLICEKFPNEDNVTIYNMVKSLSVGLGYHTGFGEDASGIGMLDKYLKHSSPSSISILESLNHLTFKIDDTAGGNGNKIAEPGETLNVYIDIQNGKSDNTQGATIIGNLVVGNSQYVNVTSPNRTWVLGPYGSIAENNAPIVVTLSAGCPQNYTPNCSLVFEKQGVPSVQTSLPFELVFNAALASPIEKQRLYGVIDAGGGIIDLDIDGVIPEGNALSIINGTVKVSAGLEPQYGGPSNGLLVKGDLHLTDVTLAQKDVDPWAGIVGYDNSTITFDGSVTITGTRGNNRIPDKRGHALYLFEDSSLILKGGTTTLDGYWWTGDRKDLLAKGKSKISLLNGSILKADCLELTGGLDSEIELTGSPGAKIESDTPGGGKLHADHLLVNNFNSSIKMGEVSLNHATIVDNSANPVFDCNVMTAENSIDYFGGQLFNNLGAEDSFKYSDTQNKAMYEGSAVQTNKLTNFNPEFMNRPGGDYHLDSTSPCLFAAKQYSHQGAFNLDPANVIVVGPDPDDDFATIQAAIDEVDTGLLPHSLPMGTIIMVKPGTYVENLYIDSTWFRLISMAGPDVTVIDGSGDNLPVVYSNGNGYVNEQPMMIKGFTIKNGKGGTFGSNAGGMYFQGASLILIGNIVRDNNVPSGAGTGGLFAISSSNQFIEVLDNIFCSNRGSQGGAIEIQGSLVENALRVKIMNNIIVENEATNRSGGIHLFAINSTDPNVYPEISNNLIVGNRAGNNGYGSAIGMQSVNNAIISNNTIYGNGGDDSSPYYYWQHSIIMYETTAMFTNNIIRNNTRDIYGYGITAEFYVHPDSAALIDYNNIEASVGGFYYKGSGIAVIGPHNRDVDPLFVNPDLVDPLNADFSLTAGSTSIDAGNNNVFRLPEIDLEWNPRIGNGVVDLGAYENN